MLKKVLFPVVIGFVLAMLFVLSYFGQPGINKFNVSVFNLGDIGLALREYVKENDNTFPDKLEQLELYRTNPEKFESPLKPKKFNGPSYIYIAGHIPIDNKLEARKYIVAYENPEYSSGYLSKDNNHPFIALYLNGTAARMKKDKFLESLEETYKHLGKPMPEIQFKD